MKLYIAALVMALTASTASAQTSPDNSRVPPLASVRDSAGAAWTLTAAGAVLRNGIDQAGSGSALLVWKGQVYVLGGNNLYWSYGGAAGAWTSIGADPSGGAVVEPPVPVTGSSRIGWTQAKQTVAQSTVGGYTLYVDAVGQAVTGVACVLVAADSTCTAPLPALKPGVHTLAISYTVNKEESLKSAAISVTTSTVVTPINFGLRP